VLPLQEAWAYRKGLPLSPTTRRKSSSRTKPLAWTELPKQSTEGKGARAKVSAPGAAGQIEEVVDDRDLPEDTEAQTEEPPPYDLKRTETMIRTMKAEDCVKLLENISFLEGF
jgi:hypothetical protein